MRLLLLIIAFVVVTYFAEGCTGADMAQLHRYGNKATATCFSGGKAIYQGRTSGAINNQGQSDGFVFADTTGRPVEVSGTCTFIYDH